ncbi:transporter [Pseudomonas sp. 31-12]|uniref:copper chaperone PCu(A)C n=1 Tax=Pseudomonas sp. 31-12 TaxID=2201356 RepID=UPI000D6ACD6E|nr:copper chaperone PCu(A)C [Pseudomonas sp. 31-12]AWM92495.1 transporter [Pseudomonas sp. 31-12]
MPIKITNIPFLKNVIRLLFGFSLTVLAWQVSAEIQVKNAWVRATVAGQQSSGAFMTLKASKDSKLLSVQSAVAPTVQIHQSSMKDDVMSMHQVEYVALPAGKSVSFEPHGYHVMLLELKAQIRKGDTVLLTIIVENADGEIDRIGVEAEVRSLGTDDHGDIHKQP